MIGPLQYAHLLTAMRFYEKKGFQPLEVPWAVSKEAMNITRPAWAGPLTLAYQAGGVEYCPVASAEQSFLQMQMDAIARGERMRGEYVAITPCFRNEPLIDDLHQPYFMKVELISWARTDEAALHMMVNMAQDCFHPYSDTSAILATDPDPIGVGMAIDIVGLRSRIELGSYGLREHPLVGRWLYGTGMAEPRLSRVIAAEGA
jgi:hypothetical protein